ncbi:nad dehydrogenase [Culex quinquefasciatus]|uniref:Nad dehydrogenase n=1 Tax=Culex quinquefasciatus TaxID=7176 RepID=B0WFI8_CULQU|nr:nad dehydrogenase [Culex quinquefasciatus]|eukprot:XP_001847472.1 nad dehydrogenase [Culex quinquefasciatus]
MSSRHFDNPFEDYDASKHGGADETTLLDKPLILKLVKDYVERILTGSGKSDYKLRADLYVGEAGIAYMFWKLSRSKELKDLFPCLEHARHFIQRAKEIAAASSKSSRTSRVAFLCGNAGVAAVSAVIAHDLGEQDDAQRELHRFHEGHSVAVSGGYDADEILVGRAGYLSGAFWLNQVLPAKPIKRAEIEAVCVVLLKRGREYAKARRCAVPLMYEYHESDYLGAAHGLCSILHMLLESPWFGEGSGASETKLADIRGSVEAFLEIQDENGNFPTRLVGSDKKLTHWCHGCSGAIYLLARAYLVFEEEKYLAGCRKCADSIWRHGLLYKGPGICHGVAGNGYAFLLMYRLTGEKRYLYRAGKFAEFLSAECFVANARTPDRPFSLHFSGTAAVSQTAARVVIAGAGLLGNSVAYHLTQNGWNNVIVLDQRTIGSGTSDFGSGTIGLFKPSPERNIILESVKLYERLQRAGHNVGLKRCGSLNLAQTHDRVVALKRRIAYNMPAGLYCELIDAETVRNLHPLLNVDDIQGAVYVPKDCIADPALVLEVLAKLSKQAGVKYFENCRVEFVNTKGGRVESLETDIGTIKCEYFINCTGMWSRELGLRCKRPVRIPAYPAQHFFAVTAGLNLPEAKLLPCVRDYDSNMYARQLGSEMMVGWFEKAAKPAFENIKDIPKNWKEHIEDSAPNHWEPLWDKAVDRIPLLTDSGAPTITNSPDNFTPDGRWIFGETAEVKNYYVACGMNGNPLQGSGGVGKALAEWIVNGTPTIEMLPFNIQRFLDLHNNRQYLQHRIREVVGRQYAILYPNQSEYKFARQLRCSPLYSELETRGAVFGTKMAYERALYFDSDYERK